MQKRDTIIAILIISFGLFLRAIPAAVQPASEADNLIYLSLANQLAAHPSLIAGFHKTSLDALSGFPKHNPYTESTWLVLIPTYLYLATRPLLSLQSSMYLIQVLFSLLGMAVVYLLVKKLTGETKWALLALFLFATLPVAVFKNSITEWRGDSFSPILLGASLLFLIYFLDGKSLPGKAIFGAGSILFLYLAYAIWEGGTYGLATYAFIVACLLVYKKSGNLKKTAIGMAAIAVVMWVVLVHFSLIPQIYNFKSTGINTTSETRPATILTYFSGFLLSTFLMFFTIIGIHLVEATEEQKRIFIILFAALLVGSVLSFSQVRLESLMTMPVAALAGASLWILASVQQKYGISEGKLRQIFYLVVVATVFVSFYSTLVQPLSVTSSFQYEKTMAWVNSNTPTDSTFLSLWQDGSAIEGWGNRTSFTDSVPGETPNTISGFSHLLYSKAYNFSYINQVHPNYLLVRQYWMGLENSILIEGNLTSNTPFNGSNFQLLESGYNTLTTEKMQLRKVYEEYNSIIYNVYYVNQNQT